MEFLIPVKSITMHLTEKWKIIIEIEDTIYSYIVATINS